MAKSIRSKIKRKSRREFRETIGQDFRDKKMKQIQDTLKANVEKQTLSMESLERLSKALATPTPTPVLSKQATAAAAEHDMDVDGSEAAAAAAAAAEETAVVVDQRGENSAPKSVHKKSNARRKHAPKTKPIDHFAVNNKKGKNNVTGTTEGEKRRPRNFVQF
jgi:hypothetical protein